MICDAYVAISYWFVTKLIGFWFHDFLFVFDCVGSLHMVQTNRTLVISEILWQQMTNSGAGCWRCQCSILACTVFYNHKLPNVDTFPIPVNLHCCAVHAKWSIVQPWEHTQIGIQFVYALLCTGTWRHTGKLHRKIILKINFYYLKSKMHCCTFYCFQKNKCHLNLKLQHR